MTSDCMFHEEKKSTLPGYFLPFAEVKNRSSEYFNMIGCVKCVGPGLLFLSPSHGRVRHFPEYANDWKWTK